MTINLHSLTSPTIWKLDPLGRLGPRQQPVASPVQELKAKVQQAFHYRAEDRHIVAASVDKHFCRWLYQNR